MHENPLIRAAEALDRLAGQTERLRWLRAITDIKEAMLDAERDGAARYCRRGAQEQICANCRAALEEREDAQALSALPMLLRRSLFLLAPDSPEAGEIDRGRCELQAAFIRRVSAARLLFEEGWESCPPDQAAAERRAFEDQEQTAKAAFDGMLDSRRGRLILRQHQARREAIARIEQALDDLPDEDELLCAMDGLRAREMEISEKWKKISEQTDISQKQRFSVS